MSFPSPVEIELYRRQMRLPELGLEGQCRLRTARLLMVGAGGLGVPASLYLAAAGVGSILLSEDDTIELSNLHRQPIYGSGNAGSAKGRRWETFLRERFPEVECSWSGHRFDGASAGRDLRGVDLVLDCVDHFGTRFLLHDEAIRRGIPVVSASLHRWEGLLASFLPQGEGGCLRCLWPQQPEDECVGTCAQTGILGPVAGMMGCLQATEAIKLLAGIDGALQQHQLMVDLRDYSMNRIRRVRRTDCSFCTVTKPVRESTPAEVLRSGEMEVLAGDAELLAFRDHQVIDLREHGEPGWPLPAGLPFNMHLPMSQLQIPDPRLPKDRDLLLVCAHGVRSLWITASLRANGYPRAWSLKGGMEGLRELSSRANSW